MKGLTFRREGNKGKWELAGEIVFYLLVFAAIACFAMLQTYGDPPDEINRFKVVNFIWNHGRLPYGGDPEVILNGYGASYAFQPILTYIIQGYLLRFLALFTADGYVLLLAARMVNVCFGVLMAYFVRLISKEAWRNPYIQWTFTLLVVFLPQNIFIHSYVNTDSMAMLSVSIIFYALMHAQRTGYDKKDCLLLAAGIILCAMSYYNAYGIILAAILIFIISFIYMVPAQDGGDGKRKLKVKWQQMFRKGSLISVIVFLGIGWWFIRNAILYGGDIIAMNARLECAIETATAEFNPLTRFTYQKEGIPLNEMLFDTGYITLLRDSFIAMFGPMLIPTHGLIYIFYKRLWIIACVLALLPVKAIGERLARRSEGLEKGGRNLTEEVSIWESYRNTGKKDMAAFYVCMTLFGAITIGLSIYYSYTWEFQPQGRYILPVLIPFMYLVTIGVQKACIVLERIRMRSVGKVLCLGIMAYVMLSFAYSLFDRFIPYYLQGENMFSMYGNVFVP